VLSWSSQAAAHRLLRLQVSVIMHDTSPPAIISVSFTSTAFNGYTTTSTRACDIQRQTTDHLTTTTTCRSGLNRTYNGGGGDDNASDVSREYSVVARQRCTCAGCFETSLIAFFCTPLTATGTFAVFVVRRVKCHLLNSALRASHELE